MFVNWVYRSNRDLTNHEDDTIIGGYSTNGETAPLSGCEPLVNQTHDGQIVETWSGGGFYNRRPNDNQAITTARFDWSLSGNIRAVNHQRYSAVVRICIYNGSINCKKGTTS